MKDILPPIVTLAAAALFASGYAYLDAFYDFFGVSMREINPGIHEVLVFSTTSLGSILAIILVPGIAIIIISALYDKEADRRPALSKLVFLSPSKRTMLLVSILIPLISVPPIIKASRIAVLENAKRHLKNSFQNSLHIDKGQISYPFSEEISRGLLKGGSYREHHFLFATESTIFAITKISPRDDSLVNSESPDLIRVGYDMIRIPRGSDVVFSVHRQDDPLKTSIGE